MTFDEHKLAWVGVDPDDRELAATLHVLAAPLLQGRVERYVDVTERGVDFAALLQLPWSSSEQAMIELACTLWGRSDLVDARVRDLVRGLDDHNFDRALQAIRVRCGHARPDLHSVPGAGSPLLAALAYAAAGWPVLPVHTPTAGGCSCARPECRAIGKHARIRNWPRRASTDASVITGWWRRWPGANVAVATGTILVLDVDGPEGAQALRDLQSAHDPLPVTRRAITARGAHLYLCADTHLISCSAAQLGPGLDVRARGGYVIAPPSRHATGHRYRWANTHPLAPLPPWLAKLLTSTETTKSARVALPAAVTGSGGDRAARYLQAALDGELAQVAGARETRNNTLNRSAFRLGQLVGAGLGDAAQITDALLAAALTAGLGEREARATIASGLTAGRAHPRPLADVA
jgi:hypothetical protein